MPLERWSLLQGVCAAGMVGVRFTVGEISDLTWAPAWKLVCIIKAKTISSVERTKHYLAWVNRINQKINGHITVDHDEARAQVAEQAVMHAEDRGPLYGIPISIKDLVLTRELRSTDGALSGGCSLQSGACKL